MPRDGAPGIGLRRNGKQQSCEPCRKGKLACDHSLPHCGRCVRRQITQRCIYHPAPMTKPKTGTVATPLLSPQSIPSISSDQRRSLGHSPQIPITAPFQAPSNHDQTFPESTHISPVSPMDEDHARSIAQTLETTDWHGRSWNKDSILPRSARYYGPTSFSSVFTENALLDSSEEYRRHPSSWQFGQPLLGRDRPSAPTVRMNQVLKTLWNIPSQEICESLMGTFASHHHILMNPVLVKHAIATLWSTFGEQLAGPRTPEKLTFIAETLFRNEEKTLPPPPDDGIEWLDTFVGRNLRFEMLGIMFVFFGTAYQSLLDDDSRFAVPENQGRDRKQTTWRMKECADICLKMCEISETNNEITVALMLCTVILESVCTGDESFQLQRRLADTVVSALGAGLHRLDYGTTKTTTALEYKRLVISAIYSIDKTDASMNGVPVRLSKRFCMLSLPLDLTDEELFLPRQEFVTAVSNLGPEGWRRKGEVHNATWHRGIQLLSRCREDILEMALGVDLAITPQDIDYLHQKCQHVYDSLPSQLHYYEYNTTPKHTTGSFMTSQAYLMLVNLQNRLLTDRVATARGFANDQRLLNTAMEMLEISLMYWMKRDQLIAFYSNLDWIVTCYGIPSAGVICVELLKQSKGQSRLQLSRSDAIQKLTLFIGFLEWIRPTDGNYQLAGRLKNVVRKVVDHILDPPQQEISENSLLNFPLDPMLAPLDANTLDWLNTIDWTQGSWMEFN